MLLETLLLSPCFLAGKTYCEENKTRLSIDKKLLQEDEALLVFHIDDQSNKSCKLRQLFWGNQEGHQLCDYIVFFAKSDQRIFCFVELKDNKKDLVKATEQVISTYEKFREKIDSRFKFIAKAFICSSGGSLPQEHKSCQLELNKKFQANFEEDGSSVEFLKFLRGESKKIVNKGRKR